LAAEVYPAWVVSRHPAGLVAGPVAEDIAQASLEVEAGSQGVAAEADIVGTGGTADIETGTDLEQYLYP
jgi:hypothetical protein